jgi:hypothetical protein
MIKKAEKDIYQKINVVPYICFDVKVEYNKINIKKANI